MFIYFFSRFSSFFQITKNTGKPLCYGLSGVLLGGDDRDRTDYLLNAIQALSQVSYAPIHGIKFKKFAFERGCTLDCLRSQVSYAPVCFVRSLERFLSIAQPGGNCKRFFQKNQVFLKKGKTHRNIPENGTNLHNKPSAVSAYRRKSPGGVHKIFTTKISVHAIIFLGITPGQSAAAAKETTR